MVPLMSEEMKTPMTSSPAVTADSNASMISATLGCEEVGNSPVSRMRR
jgi:hypothetical protein